MVEAFESIVSSPWSIAMLLVTPLVIIGLKRSLDKFKAKIAEKKAAQG